MTRLIFPVIYFLLFFYQLTVSLKPKLHTTLSKSEVRAYLQVDTHETVPEYDVIQISRQRKKRSDLPSQKRFGLSAFGKDIQLLVEPNNDVVDNDGLPVERTTVDGTLEKEIHFPKGRFYVGHVASDPKAHVAVRELDEERGHLSGAIMSDGHFYQIVPLPGHLHQHAALPGTGHHVITRRSVESLMNDRKKSVPVIVPGFKHLYKRSNDQVKLHDDDNQDGVYSGTVYIEAMLTADKTTCDYYGNGTLDYLLNTANLISRLYKDKSLGMNVSWVLVKVFLLEGFDPAMDLTTNQIVSAGKYIRKFRKWSEQRNAPDGRHGHYDQAALLTRRICGLSSCYIDGLAYFNTPCSSKWGVSVNEARGLTAAFTVAHEMGHNIGLLHDTGDCAKGDIMNSVQASGPNAFKWSRCSREKFQKIFTSFACFHNKPPKTLPSPSLPPGYVHNIDKQCQLAYGEEYRACSSLRESCGALYCTTGGSCYSRGAPVAEGTACGYRKWCMAGTCANVGTSLPPPVDGNWGPWSSYGACTRTCGGGVKYRSRKCNNPRPQYFGKDCVGSNKGHFAMCNIQTCAFDRFRQEQCEEHNTDTKTYRPHYLRGARKCTLACVSGNKGSFFGNVKDGTRCTEDPHDLDVCIEGKCYMVGCDKKLLSGKLLDRCLNCGGDGSSCVLIKGLYNKNYRVYGPKSGDTMFVIPKGATRILIKEISKSYNFLSIVSNTSSKYYVPVPSWSATFNAAGTSIYHYMNHYNDAETIFIRGPTNEALQAKYVYSGINGNPGIEYSYYIPGNGQSKNFVWKQKNEGSCNASCAGGIQLIKVTCHRQDDNTEVTSIYCDNSTKPDQSLPCNVAPCPKEFQLGVWSPCSKLCGGGQQHRNLTCVQVVSNDVTQVLPESQCAHLTMPTRTQECGSTDCLPEWTVGEWTQCSVPCGGSNKTRQVECRQKFRNGTWSTVPDDECSVGKSEKPPTSMPCNSMPCFKWRVDYPCLSCGGSTFSYVPIGCYLDNHTGTRPLPKMVGNHRNNINWYHMSETVRRCAKDTWRKKFPVFAVQFYGECWSGPFGYITYDKDGFSSQGCWEGVGKARNNYVYAFTNLVSIPLVDCIFTVSNQTVQEDKCTAPRPDARMKLCSDACKT